MRAESAAEQAEPQSQPIPATDTPPAQRPEDAHDHEDPAADADADAHSRADADDRSASGNIITRSLPRFHDAFASDEEFINWRDSFYIHKQFERIPEAIGYFCSSALYEDVSNRIPMAAFVGAVFRQSDETVDLVWDELMLEGREDELMTLGYAAWLANTPHSRKIYYRAREIWESENLVRMFHMLHQAKNLDTMERPDNDFRVMKMLWNEFYATGDEERLRRVVQLSYMYNAPEGTWQRMSGQAAREPLVRLLPYDTLVRRVAEDEARNNSKTAIRTHLTMLLEEVGPLRERPEIPAAR